MWNSSRNEIKFPIQSDESAANLLQHEVATQVNESSTYSLQKINQNN